MKKIIWCLTLLVLISCAGSGKYNISETTFEKKLNESNLFFARPSKWYASASRIPILINGKEIIRLGIGEKGNYTVQLGKNTITSTFEIGTGLYSYVINAKPNTNYFFIVEADQDYKGTKITETSELGFKNIEHDKVFLEKRIAEIKADEEVEIKKKTLIAEQQQKKESDEKKKIKLAELEKTYSNKCNFGYTKGTEKYNNCLLEQEKKDLAEQKKKQDLAEASRKKSEAETKQMAEKLAKMTPDDRRAYMCTEKFGFRKGSDKFKDCLFELYKAETELEKLELQKQVAKANLEAAKVKETAARSEQDRANALLLRQTLAQEMSAAAALQQARIADFESNQRLFDTGMEMLRGERRVDGSYRAPARAPMNCQYHAKMLSCF